MIKVNMVDGETKELHGAKALVLKSGGLAIENAAGGLVILPGAWLTVEHAPDEPIEDIAA